MLELRDLRLKEFRYSRLINHFIKLQIQNINQQTLVKKMLANLRFCQKLLFKLKTK